MSSPSSPSTTGIQLKTRRPVVAEIVELISSMRFAIALLAMIAIAAVIGTVMKQGEASSNYLNQFGPFWYEVFRKVGLYTVYSAWWFLLLMAVLVISTTLCIVRNAPKMLKDMRSWRENVREQSLLNFHHKTQWRSSLPRAALAQQSADRLKDAGYQVRIVDKDNGTLVAAKRGAANKFGYIFAHASIVVICIGGLLDSDVPIRLQEWFLGKTPFKGSGLISQVPPQHRLSVNNPTFRGNTMIPEGQNSNTAILTRPDGVLIQELPITIDLKKFTIDFYSTGMPKLYASDVEVRDNASGKIVKGTIEVNKPLIVNGLAIYQSSFEDGGSKLKLKGYAMLGGDDRRFDMDGEVGGATTLNDDYTVEWSGFRPFNVENIGAGNDPRSVKQGRSLQEELAQSLDQHTGSAGKNAVNKDLKNIGPSVSYKLRDKTGQAREFNNYMQPVTIDGATVFLAGMRTNPADNFSYLRIPADDAHGLNEWMRLRAALQNPDLRAAAARRYAARATVNSPNSAMRDTLQASADKSLSIFAGNQQAGGFMAVSQFLSKVPAEAQEKTVDAFMKILNGSLWDLWQVARAKDGLAPVSEDEAHARFLQLATNALSDVSLYGAPVFLQLDEFTEIKASVFQITRSPGKNVVYLGCLFLVLGVFAMFYIRERRLWIWLKDEPQGAAALMAMSTQRKTLDFEKEFETLKEKLPQPAA
ncbi:cytochrome c biogenesis protein ResB [Duganella sp. P38]|uniref:cytochrome c biogenesis protein ResB n=1 Tax=Duganella sp. P38 TaxID=3423949 RepID=UPI003D79A3E3